LNEQSSSFPRVQTSAMKEKQTVPKRSKRRPTSCGCNKRTNQSISSHNIERQQKKVTNHHTPIITQDNSTPKKSTSEEISIVSPQGTKASYTPQKEQHRQAEENSPFKKMIRYCEKLFFFQWLRKRND
jgi:hypothetical protein